MEARLPNPAMLLPDVNPAIQQLIKATHTGGAPETVLELVHLRASQINGCSLCVGLHARGLKKAGESDERIVSVSAWREAPYYTDAERAALALAEAVTRLSDRPDPVPDELWEDVTKHYSELELSALLVAIASVNVWNRLNAATRQVAGSFTG
jgi:AhpD family alkylhydroperoxidase